MAERDFEELLNTINRINTELTKLGQRTTEIQREMSSGHWGTQQLKEFREELNRLTQATSTKRANLDELVNRRDLTLATKDFNSLVKSIETLQQRIALGKGAAGLFKTDDPQYQKLMAQIASAERALASFETRKFTQFTPQGTRRGPDVPFQPVDLEGRLAGQPSQSVGNRTEIRRKGREAAERMLNQLQNELLRGAIEAKANEQQNELLRAAIRDRQRTSGTPPYTDVPGGYAGTGGSGKPPPSTPPPPPTGSDDENARRKRKEEEERLLKNLRQRVASEEKYRLALEQAQRLGFTINDLQKVNRRGTAGIEHLQFARRDESGIAERFDTYVNPSGRSTPGISNQFRSFGQGVLRDVGELTKWSLALAAVYGPMRKLQELTQIMIENQSRLAEAATSVSSAFIGQDEIFDAAAEAAERAGESVDGVIDAFTQAFRATGGGGTDIERFATAQTLLNDALLLSKLSTLDQAQAIDTLSAALRQTSGDLTAGSELLDKWVRVTKVANVDLASLATGFAVLGDAAEAAGLDADQLNGILAAIGETGIASGRELANTARAIVGLFQTDQAREALERIGVAVETSTGKARPFLEILREIDQMQETGVLSPEAFSELTLDIGQGVRRQAQVTAIISSQERIGEVAKESANAQGDAQAALTKQLETVQTSLTRLQNAFQELAQTLGVEGGFLGIITNIVDGMTGMVKILDDLIGLLGKATPAMLAFVAATAALKYQGQGGVQQALGNIGAGLQRDPLQAILNPAQAPAKGVGRQFLQNNVLGTNATSGGIQGLFAAALPAILNFTNEQDRFGKTKAGFDLVGGIGGGIIGAVTGVGPVIGSMIGIAAAEAFANATIARKTEIFGYTAPTLAPVTEDVTGGTTPTADLDEALREAEAEIYRGIGGGSEEVGRIINSLFVDRTASLVEEINKAIDSGDKERFDELAGNKFEAGYLQRAGITQEMLQQAFGQGRQIQFNPESLAYQQTTQAAREQFDAAAAARAARGGTPLDQTTPFSREVSETIKRFGPLLDAMTEATETQLRQQRVEGDVRGAEYGRRTQALGGFDIRAAGYYTALGDEVSLLTGGADDAAAAFQVLNNVIIGGAEEALPQLTTLKGEIETITNMLADPEANAEGIADLGGISAAREQLEEYRRTLAEIISDMNQQVLVGRIQRPDIVGDINKPYTTPEENLIEQRTSELETSFYKDFLQLPDDMFNAIKDSFEPFAVPIKDFEDSVVDFKEVVRTDAELRQAAIAQLLEEGALGSQKTDPFGIQQIDLDSSRAGELQGLINYFTNYLSTNFPQYEQNPEDVGVIFNDYVTSILHGDNLAIKLALEKLVDLNQKQLDGMYNIPEGATFWVPLTAAYYRPQNEGGQGGLPAVEQANNQATDRNTMAVDANTLALYEARYDKMQEFGTRGNRHEDRYDFMNKQPERLRHEDRFDYMNDTTPRAAGKEASSGTGGMSAADRGLYGINPVTSLLNQLQTWLSTFLNQLKTSDMPFSGRGNTPGPGGTPPAGYGSTAIPATQQQPVQARLQIEMDNTTQLIVDGRILASVISPYLAQEMVRLEASQGTITRRFVI